jgi:glucose dehydrogenase
LAWRGRTRLGSGGGGQEATPLVWNNTIYGITNWSVVFAVDARTGKEKWRWDPWVNKTRCGPRSAAAWSTRPGPLQGMVYVPVIDGRLQALDATTGKVVWESRGRVPQDHYTLTMAPRIAKAR